LTRTKTCSFQSRGSASSRALTRRASPSLVTLSNDAVSSSSTDSRCAGPRRASLMRACRSGTTWTNARLLQARYRPLSPFECGPVCLISYNAPSVGQRVYSVHWGLVRMPCAPGPKARGAELSHSDSRLSRRCAGIARAVGMVPQGWKTDLPWDAPMDKRALVDCPSHHYIYF
jgi:hypothetical protein